ncbi:MAG: L,D-transpeptidase [Caulobacterales bacterium]|nr:L,D-transpeptidase [Caulobacterales bacterium]MCA0373441.1 L,D-transpeptidase [Pseudomonadota bacterium]
MRKLWVIVAFSLMPFAAMAQQSAPTWDMPNQNNNIQAKQDVKAEPTNAISNQVAPVETPPIATNPTPKPPTPKITKPARGTERLIAKVSIKKQTILISLDNELIYKWSVSTGKKGFETPPGYYNGQRKYVLWRSRTYDNAPMPFAVFFYEGYAVHGTTALSQLGKPASHGCVRVTTPNAKTFYDLVDEVGLSQTLVIVEN